MTEEPYRWLEAVANRRDYVHDQLKGASPVFAASLPDGILLLGVGGGQSKVFELFDRHALAGLGHPADLEKIRQAAIDVAHTEAFTRAPEDVTLRRIVSYGLSPQLKQNFEQIFSAPFLAEMILAEVETKAERDLIVRLHFDGAYRIERGGLMVAASQREAESAAQDWLAKRIAGVTDRAAVAERFLEAWWCVMGGEPFEEVSSFGGDSRAGWRGAIADRTVEIGWLDRGSARRARYMPLQLADLGL